VAGLVAVVALVSAACSSSATPTTPTPVAPSRMLTAADLGPGWAVVGPTAAGLPCSAPMTPGAIVGHGGSVVRLARDSGLPTVVEYAADTASPLRAYVSAIDALQTSASCAADTPAHALSSRFVGVLPLPGVGLRSVVMAFANTADGVTSQSGYEVVRLGRTVAVVGTTTAGPLDAAGLQHVTAVALGKLDR
jgi:hypothetical protein